MLDVNEYFDGAVKSIAFSTPNLPATVGVMTQGDYSFATDCKEVMTVVCGELVVRLPAETTWQTFTDGQSFEVEKDASFDVKVTRETAYLCKYWR